LDVASLGRLPELARAYALVTFLREHHPGELAADDVERALALLRTREGPKARQWTLHLPGGRLLLRRGGRLLLDVRRPASPPALRRLDDVRVRAPAGWEVTGGRVSGTSAAGLTLANIPAGATLDVRPRQPGDRFHPPWRPHAVKVKDFLRDQRVPLWERDRLPVLVWNGRIVAIYPRFVARGFAAAEARGSNGQRLLALQLSGTDF
jgi:tRNA(Ile)-lysidine synthetase-like protein